MDKADKQTQELLALFQIEANELLETLNQVLLQFETNQLEPEKRYSRIIPCST